MAFGPDGKGEGFGNKISIQTVAIVKAAKAARRVHSVDAEKTVCGLTKFIALIPALTFDRCGPFVTSSTIRHSISNYSAAF
jgi:hypothetical protein